MKTKLSAMIRVTISLVFIGLLMWMMRGNWQRIVDSMRKIDPLMFFAGAAVFIAASLALALRLAYLLKGAGFRLTLKEVISLTFIGYFFNNFLPTAIGGDMVKGYYAAKSTKDKAGCFSTILLDRLIGLLSLFILAGLAALFTRAGIANDMPTWPIYVVVSLMLIFFTLLWNRNLARFIFSPILRFLSLHGAQKVRNLEGKIRKTYDLLHGLKARKGVIAKVFVISCAGQFISFMTVYFWSRGIGAPLPFRAVLLGMPLVMTLAILPSINGLGVREMAMVIFFGPFMGRDNAFAMSILWLLILYVISIIGGINYAFNSQFKIKEKTA